MPLPSAIGLTPADSARAVGELYGVSLVATLPIVVAVGALLLLRRSGAGARVIALRAATVAMLVLYAARFLPMQWTASIVPEGLAAPLVALGRAQLSVVGSIPALADAAQVPARALAAPALLSLYWVGVATVLLMLLRARWQLHQLVAGSPVCDSRAWRAAIERAAGAAGLGTGGRQRARVYRCDRLFVPLTWGNRRRPVVVLPVAAESWNREQLHATLVHEFSHARHGDARSAVVARIACALFWFHPGVWWIAARLARESELACDDRVLMSGVRRSDYAELLVMARAAATTGAPCRLHTATALVRSTGLRERLAAIVDTSRALRVPSRRAMVWASLISGLLAAPLGMVRVGPTREVLTTLMGDARWESRAYAVTRLAQRADSVEVARRAADHDPSPQVRAWAQYALAHARMPADRDAAPREDASGRIGTRTTGPTTGDSSFFH